uniref:Secreted protein n=1 Tax=Macrostomum lignano TaxID=282301 RepID=A0A1I8FI56_9PLAT
LNVRTIRLVYRQRSRSVTLAPAPSSTPEVDAVVATPTVLTMPTAARRRSMDDHSCSSQLIRSALVPLVHLVESVAAAETGQQTRRRCSLFATTRKRLEVGELSQLLLRRLLAKLRMKQPALKREKEPNDSNSCIWTTPASHFRNTICKRD